MTQGLRSCGVDVPLFPGSLRESGGADGDGWSDQQICWVMKYLGIFNTECHGNIWQICCHKNMGYHGTWVLINRARCFDKELMKANENSFEPSNIMYPWRNGWIKMRNYMLKKEQPDWLVNYSMSHPILRVSYSHFGSFWRFQVKNRGVTSDIFRAFVWQKKLPCGRQKGAFLILFGTCNIL